MKYYPYSEMKPYGQVFVGLKKNFYIRCTHCNEEIIDYLEFQNHVLEIHLDLLLPEKVNNDESKENLIELEIKSESLDESDVLNNGSPIDNKGDTKNEDFDISEEVGVFIKNDIKDIKNEDIEIINYSILDPLAEDCPDNNDLSNNSNRKNEQCEFCERYYSPKALEKHRAKNKCGECPICFRKYTDINKHLKFYHSAEEQKAYIPEKNSLLNKRNNDTQSNESQLNFQEKISGDDLMDKELDKNSENQNEIVGKDDEVTCKFCGKSFSKQKFISHEARRKCGKCPVCLEIFLNVYKHISKFHKEYSDEQKLKGENVVTRLPVVGEYFNNPDKSFRCSYCDKIFKKEKSYKKHIIYHETFLNTCKICGKRFSQSYALKRHARRHSRNNPFKCTQCLDSFTTDKRLEFHVSTKHALVLGDKVICTFKDCGKEFISAKRKRYHELNAHLNEYKLCVDCGLKFKRGSTFNSHYKTVHLKYEDREFSCKFCGLKFAWKYEMIPHELSHVGQKRFICELCPNGYGRRWHLKRHYLSSHGRDMPKNIKGKCEKKKN